MKNFIKYFEKYFEALKNLYIDEIKTCHDYKIVRSDFIDDKDNNFVFDLKFSNIASFEMLYKVAAKELKDREPRFYILKSEKNAKFLDYFKSKYNICCEDSWFFTNVEKLKLNHKAKIDIDIELSQNKQEIIDTILEGFSNDDLDGQNNEIFPAYRECLNNKLSVPVGGTPYKTYHYVAKHNGKVIAISTITTDCKDAFLDNVTTLKEYRRLGVAKEVLTFIINQLKLKNVKNIIFTTIAGAYTEEIYKSLGFQVVDYGVCFEEAKFKSSC